MSCTKTAENCKCTYNCPKRGKCCDCLAYHRPKGQLPACYFSPEVEKTYDRSIEKFISTYTR